MLIDNIALAPPSTISYHHEPHKYPHISTIANLTSLLTFRTEPPNKIISKARLDTARILTQLHFHNIQWLHHLLLIYRIKSRTTTRRNSTYRTHTFP
jgi:hypothetical protein